MTWLSSRCEQTAWGKLEAEQSAARQHAQRLDTDAAQAASERADAQRKLAGAQQQCVSLQTQLEAKDSELESMQRSESSNHSNTEQALQRTKSEVQEHKRKPQALQSQAAGLEAQLSEAHSNAEQMRAEVQEQRTAAQQVSNLQQQLSAATAQLPELERMCSEKRSDTHCQSSDGMGHNAHAIHATAHQAPTRQNHQRSHADTSQRSVPATASAESSRVQQASADNTYNTLGAFEGASLPQQATQDSFGAQEKPLRADSSQRIAGREVLPGHGGSKQAHDDGNVNAGQQQRSACEDVYEQSSAAAAARQVRASPSLRSLQRLAADSNDVKCSNCGLISSSHQRTDPLQAPERSGHEAEHESHAFGDHWPAQGMQQAASSQTVGAPLSAGAYKEHTHQALGDEQDERSQQPAQPHAEAAAVKNKGLQSQCSFYATGWLCLARRQH